MEAATDITIWLALSAGLLSFLSPCTLPIFPAYLSYITGVSVKDLQEKRDHKLQGRLLIHAIFFLLGVSLIFFSLGVGVSFLGQWLQGLLAGESGVLIQRIAGIFLILMGLIVGGWLTIPTLMKEKRLQFKKKPIGLLGSFFVGVGFSAGWTPCIGPIFASILILAATSPAQGLLYTSFYIVGFAIPFLVLTFFLGYAKWLVKYSERITKIGGGLIILFGVLLFTGYLARFSNMLLRFVENTWFSNLG
ncbi:cytochrome c-type biogenesis protein [Pelagirhabdus alkalitolerans]|uniref:Cytochrome c-type biogenesis protein n=1 Tax=Pelagirhabdus alkalitolerans TaxID=1612202 RepID=A0A1G6KLZ3_9BACI|nr:cytochrome c biogenesis protein CcdA [Pelagirhabdus alkalitolerans]SDC32132.1 cytochrome c-type biogenesis protein [Pelagirhabdus alkalitolerans]